MTPEQKQMFKKMLLLGFGATLLITGLVILWFSRETIRDMITDMKEPYDALSVDMDELKPGDHVTVDVVLTEGYFMYKSKSMHKGNTYSYASTTRYYLVPVLDESGEYYKVDHLVAVSKTGQFKAIDAAAKSYIAWWNGEGDMPTEKVYSVDGRVAKLNDEEIGYLEKYFGDDDYEDYMVPYVVKPLWEGFNSGKGGAIAMPITSIIVALIGAFMLFRGLRVGKKKAKAAAPATQAPAAQVPVYQNPQYQAPTPTVDQNPPYQGQTQNNDQNPPTQG